MRARDFGRLVRLGTLNPLDTSISGPKMSFFFEGYLLDPDRRELWHGSHLVPVEPQVFDLLEYLVRNRDRVVTKDEMFDAIWRGRIVSESALTSRINAARSAIGDNGEDQRLIRTLRGKGFRFVGAVTESSEKAVGSHLKRHPSNLQLALPDRPSIAVLPFINLSGDPEQEFFADGMTEDIITGLSQIRDFFVIARNTMFTYKGRPVDVQALSAELGVRYLLEGSVRKVGNRVRITSQLNDGTIGRQIWANHYDRDLQDIFALQDEIAQTVIGVLGPELSRAEQQRALIKPPENLDAWELFHRGMFHFYKRTLGDNSEARRYFELAIQRDPKFAPAYAGISRALSVDWILLAPERSADAAFQMARRSIELDERAAISHYALGVAYLLVGRNGEAARNSFEDALRLNPNDAQLHMLMGAALTSTGQAEAAISHVERAIRLSPFDSNIGIFYGRLALANLFLGRYEAAAEWGRKATDKPGTWLDRVALPASLAELGRNDEARTACEALRSLWPSLTIQVVRDNEPTAYPPYLDVLSSGLRKAGLPER